ncbi:MAG: hypothetical protein JSS90_07545 [Bacteroidetes bacterium]|jgi:tetrahydromethanopterin S-methyltransferase subunit F|nr:hypothetical protein [Bacteroidota bacterium]
MALRKSFVFLLLIFIGFNADAQDTLCLLNGKIKTVKFYNLNDPDWVRYVKSSGSNRVKKIDVYKVFSVKQADGTEKILYNPDTVAGDPNAEWVHDYIKGQQYGMLHNRDHFNKRDKTWHRKVNFTEIGGVAVGGAGSLLLFYGIPIPAVYAIAVGRSSPALPDAPDIAPQYKNSEGFKSGYQKHKRNQRIKQGFISGMIGFAIGVATLTIIEHK